MLADLQIKAKEDFSWVCKKSGLVGQKALALCCVKKQNNFSPVSAAQKSVL
jgi:hypothetical protein